MLIMLTDTDGLYDSNPAENENARLIERVEKITPEIENMAGGSGARGTGGFTTKIKAAKIANDAGIDLVIINGRHPDNLYGVFENKPVGTVFQAAATLA
jgi:glutamate 5-kinase